MAHGPWYRMRETVPFSVAPSYGGALGWLRLRGLRGLIEIGWKGTRDRRVAPNKCGMECGMARAG